MGKFWVVSAINVSLMTVLLPCLDTGEEISWGCKLPSNLETVSLFLEFVIVSIYGVQCNAIDVYIVERVNHAH